MEKSELVFLEECQKELAQMKERIGVLEARIAAIHQAQAAAVVPEEADEVDFTGVELGVADIPVPDIPQEEPVSEETDAPQETSPASEPLPVEEPQPAVPVQDDTAGLPWRKDNPGMMVKNIRSGISLLDRAQFIGTLFKEDFTLYDNTIAQLNGMNTLDEAVAYIREHFPEWNMNSDVVYRFMMAIRKKLG